MLHRRFSMVCALLGMAAAVAAAADSPKETATKILQESGVTGGLIIQLGCDDGQLTAALHKSDAFLVQGLDTSPEKVQEARKTIQAWGCYGPVSVELLNSKRLPYIDNLVSLIVVNDPESIPHNELLRVLSPLGIACIKNGPDWEVIRKPWPKNIDEWQQHYHHADNNAVAHDTVVGPPRHYQWLATPEWSRAHLDLPSIHSFISSQGRLFTVEDQGSIEHPALPGKFALVARDAFNGMVLWQRHYPDWHPINIYIKFTPTQVQRRLAAIGNIVYCTPGWAAPITALDAATGRELKTYAGTERTMEFAYDQDVLYTVVGDPYDTKGIGTKKGSLGSSQFSEQSYGPLIPKLDEPVCSIMAIDAKTGKKLWQKSGNDTQHYQGASLAIHGVHVVYCTRENLICLNRATGRELWRTPVSLKLSGSPGATVALVLSDTTVYLADSKSLRAFTLKAGKPMWATSANNNHYKSPDVFLTGGLVWASSYNAASGKPNLALGLDRFGANGYDPKTGKLVKHLDQTMTGPMGHDRCYRNRITDRFYINSCTGGSDFLSMNPADGGEFPNPWVRSTCGIGALPCNGLFYAGPPACSCSNGVMLNALNALAADPSEKSSGQPIKLTLKSCLEKGPAYSQISSATAPSSAEAEEADDWPTYRNDIRRSGVTKTSVPAELKPCWQVKVSTHASAPVIAAGKVFVADIDAHAVCALDAADGHSLWTFTANARVDSPPTYYRGLVLFGSRDGWVYCLRAEDGALVWRFKGLADERSICAYGQVESAWPICGSVLLKNNIAYFAAGRNSYLDGGIVLWGLDPKTGRVIHQQRMYGPYGSDGHPLLAKAGGSGIAGFKNDVFLADANLLYLRHQAFKSDLTPVAPEDTSIRPHLIASPGFLEAIPHHRSFWTIDTALHYDIQTGAASGAHGDILVVDGQRFWEVRGYTPGRTENFDPRPHGYKLYCGDLSQPRDGDKASPGKGKKGRKGKHQQPGAPAKLAKKRSPAMGSTKVWQVNIPITGKAIAMAGKTLFIAGTPVVFPADDLAKAYEGRMGGVLWVASAEDGTKLAEYKLASPPAWDTLAAAQGQLFLCLQDGSVVCFEQK